MSEHKSVPEWPWLLCDVGDYGDYDGNCQVILDKPLEQRLAVVLFNPHDPETSRAVAHLMVAAPDMYGDASFLLDRLDEFENDLPEGPVAREFYGHIEPAMARLRAALAKAEGGAK